LYFRHKDKPKARKARGGKDPLGLNKGIAHNADVAALRRLLSDALVMTHQIGAEESAMNDGSRSIVKNVSEVLGSDDLSFHIMDDKEDNYAFANKMDTQYVDEMHRGSQRLL
jgi:hypothetical protein